MRIGRAFDNFWLAAFSALAMTALATLLCLGLQAWLPAANLALVYTAAVLLTAIVTRVIPALICAFASVLAFNFFFTEPRGSLLMSHREDILTAALLLFVAIVVGSLAGRLQSKIRSLEFRDSFARIEHRLLERVSLALEAGEVLRALQEAVTQLTGSACHALHAGTDVQPEWTAGAATLPPHLREAAGNPVHVLLDGDDHLRLHRRAARPGDGEEIREAGDQEAQVGPRSSCPLFLQPLAVHPTDVHVVERAGHCIESCRQDQRIEFNVFTFELNTGFRDAFDG